MNDRDDHEWFGREVLVHESRLRRQLRRYFQAAEDVEDVLQETYARLLSMPRAERSKLAAPLAFLFTTARNVSIDWLRRRRVVSIDTLAELDSLKLPDERPGPYDELNARQELDMLRAAIASLPERCREVMVLAKMQGRSQREIASRLGISESTVEKHLANGVRLCAGFLWAKSGREAEETDPALRRRTTGDEPR